MTLGALGLRGLTGHVHLEASGKKYTICFEHGSVVNAMSPLPVDSAVRVAVTNGLVAPQLATDLQKRVASAVDRDDVAIVVEVAGLTDEQAERLRRRVVAQRTARTFAIERGVFVIE